MVDFLCRSRDFLSNDVHIATVMTVMLQINFKLKNINLLRFCYIPILSSKTIKIGSSKKIYK